MIQVKEIFTLDKRRVILMTRKFKRQKKSASSQINKSHHKTSKPENLSKFSKINTRLVEMPKTICRCLTNNKEIILKIIGGSAILSLVGGIVANYISQQRYYDDLLDKYFNSMEKLLIKDELQNNYLDMHLPDKRNHHENNRQKKAKYKYEQVKSLALAVTGNTLRSLSKNDGMCLFGEPLKKVPLCIPWTRKNPERRELVLNFLQQSKLGFIDPDSGQRPPQPAESFLEGINLSTMSDSKILRRLDKILGKLNLCKNLEKLDLEKIQLDRAILIKANFTQANLTGAKLSNADLRDAVLTQTDLSNANLTKTNLRNAHLENATLNGTTLERANLIDANLKDVNLDNQTHFKGAVYGRTKSYSQKTKNKLEEEAIKVERGLDLSNLPPKTRKALNEVFKKDPHQDKTRLALINTDLSGVDLTNANLTGAILKDADLTNANLTGANLKDADLTGANLKGTKGAAINQAKLCNTILPTGEISVCLNKDS
ncbi:pentapeptide repeat-containing protein [Nostoc sp. CENA67]|uniref:Pentapeptide repeat-containing protein n=1 Tax=Amazonocrinis nigriterrae CENA67 TaxID=2794033 RepID=A0A8J7L9Y9_9NOST|nr:pentapeptide repeat-containing protein [Amazonocrinis nigriterrae]MBH8566119.1 pentapeptide repeat-containing protein [Amazonocrinis nigriterrae CENA67]